MVEASEIVMDSMQALFETQVAIAPNDRFGSYMQIAYGDNLLLGISNSPGNDNGGLVALLSPSGNLALETVVNEQGIHDINVFGDEIVVSGTDPTDGDWNLGNVYRRINNGTWEEFRTLPNVIHSFGTAKIGGEYFVATGAHIGDNTTYSGRVYRSSDLQNWTWAELGVNGATYRVMDIAKCGNRLYATVMLPVNYTLLMISDDNGITWSVMSNDQDYHPGILQRYCIHGDKLCIVNVGRYGLIIIEQDGSYRKLSMPGIAISTKFNVLASDGYSLYALDVSGYIWRTPDLASWQQYSQVTDAISIGYWPSQNCLVVSDKGTQAKLCKIPIQ